jgi:hypothetical protein
VKNCISTCGQSRFSQSRSGIICQTFGWAKSAKNLIYPNQDWGIGRRTPPENLWLGYGRTIEEWLANDRIDNHDDRVAMSKNLDLPVGTMAVASWTRVLNFAYADYDEDAVRDFISTHSCRFDPEGFC